MTKTMKVGDIHKWDYQSDVFRGEYRLVEDLGNGRWVIEHLEPSDEILEEIMQDYLYGLNPMLSYHDAFGPERRIQTRQEALDEEVMRRIDRAGERSEVRFVSAARYAEAF